jgi:hypothetical protein
MKNKKIIALIAIFFLVIVIASIGFFSYSYLEHTAEITCNGTGVTRNPDGTFQFSRLQIMNGYIVDQNDCVVYLSGFNTAGTEFGNAIGGMNAQRITLFSKKFRMNLWRLNINITWWNENDYVPDIHMNYRDWIAQLISWLKANGNYIELTRTNQYPSGRYPPCGIDLSHIPPIRTALCPSQNQGAGTNPWKNNPHFLDETVAFWSSIVPLYKNDPAIIYNIWNEMPGITDLLLWKGFEETLISTVRTIMPQSLIFLGGRWWNNDISALVRGIVPDFTEPNLVYDFHVYPNSAWYTNWPQQPEKETAFAQLHNHGIDIGEFGTSSNSTPYLDNVINFAIKHFGAITQYQQSNVMTKQGQLTTEGQIIQKDYAAIPHNSLRVTPTTR